MKDNLYEMIERVVHQQGNQVGGGGELAKLLTLMVDNIPESVVIGYSQSLEQITDAKALYRGVVNAVIQFVEAGYDKANAFELSTNPFMRNLLHNVTIIAEDTGSAYQPLNLTIGMRKEDFMVRVGFEYKVRGTATVKEYYKFIQDDATNRPQYVDLLRRVLDDDTAGTGGDFD